MALKLEADSKRLLGQLQDATIIGLLDKNRETIRMLEATPQMPGHATLVAAGLAMVGVHLGFSAMISAGQITYFYRSSALNKEFDDMTMPIDMMFEVLAALSIPRARDFHYYP